MTSEKVFTVLKFSLLALVLVGVVQSCRPGQNNGELMPKDSVALVMGDLYIIKSVSLMYPDSFALTYSNYFIINNIDSNRYKKSLMYYYHYEDDMDKAINDSAIKRLEALIQ